MLQVGIGHEGGNTMKDGGGEEHALHIGIKRHIGLQGEDEVAENEEDSVEEEKSAECASNFAVLNPDAFQPTQKHSGGGICHP